MDYYYELYNEYDKLVGIIDEYSEAELYVTRYGGYFKINKKYRIFSDRLSDI